MHTIERVREFHLAFGHPVEREITIPSPKTRLLRFKLLFEEVMEYGRAIGIKGLHEFTLEDFESDLKDTLKSFEIDPDVVVDSIEAADALADIDYVCAGANLCHGFPAEAVAIEVHRSNMSKLGANGKPVLAADGKVVKGPNYSPPDIESVWKRPTNLRELDSQLTRRFNAEEGAPRAWTIVDPLTGNQRPWRVDDVGDRDPEGQRVVYRVYGAQTNIRPNDLADLCAAVFRAVCDVAPYSGARMYWRRRPDVSIEGGTMKLTVRIGFHNWGKVQVPATLCDVPDGGPVPSLP